MTVAHMIPQAAETGRHRRRERRNTAPRRPVKCAVRRPLLLGDGQPCGGRHAALVAVTRAHRTLRAATACAAFEVCALLAAAV